jgi:hypothetical protein
MRIVFYVLILSSFAAGQDFKILDENKAWIAF